jgi:hypothetical protein
VREVRGGGGGGGAGRADYAVGLNASTTAQGPHDVMLGVGLRFGRGWCWAAGGAQRRSTIDEQEGGGRSGAGRGGRGGRGELANPVAVYSSTSEVP